MVEPGRESRRQPSVDYGENPRINGAHPLTGGRSGGQGGPKGTAQLREGSNTAVNTAESSTRRDDTGLASPVVGQFARRRLTQSHGRWGGARAAACDPKRPFVAGGPMGRDLPIAERQL